MSDVADLGVALAALLARSPRYHKCRTYVAGTQLDVFDKVKWLTAFGPQITQPRDNLCALAVKTHRARLRHPESPFSDLYEDATTPEQGQTQVGETGNDATDAAKAASATPSDLANAIYRRNRLAIRYTEAITESMTVGDSYLRVGIDGRGRAVWYVIRAEDCHVQYDPSRPGERLWAASFHMLADGRLRADVDYSADAPHDPDETGAQLGAGTRRWVSAGKSALSGYHAEVNQFVPYDEDGQTSWRPNPMQRIPVWQLPCDSWPGQDGQAVFWDALSIQDLQNMTLADLCVVAYYAAYPQRAIAGINGAASRPATNSPALGAGVVRQTGGESTPQRPDLEPVKPAAPSQFKAGVDRVWTFGSPDTSFHQFDAASLDGYLTSLDAFRVQFARLTQTPSHTFTVGSGSFPSGEALKTADLPIISASQLRQLVFGSVLEDAMAFAVQAELSHNATGGFVALADEPALQLAWEPADTQFELTPVQRIDALIAMGVPVDYILSAEFGMSPDEAAELQARVVAATTAAADRALAAFDAGGLANAA